MGRNPLLIGSTVLTEYYLLECDALDESQSPPNRVNGSHNQAVIINLKIRSQSQSPPNRVNGSHVEHVIEDNGLHEVSQSPPNRVNGSHGKNQNINLYIGGKSQSPPNRVNGSHLFNTGYDAGKDGIGRNPLLIGSTVLTRTVQSKVYQGYHLSQSPPNRVNGSHNSLSEVRQRVQNSRNPLLIGSTVLTGGSAEKTEGIELVAIPS